MSALTPFMFRKVSCRSPAVALERTATTTLSPICAYERVISSLISSGTGVFMTMSVTSAAVFSRRSKFSTSNPERRENISVSIFAFSIYQRNACAVTTNALGTGRPTAVISARDVTFSPTEEISSFWISESHRIWGDFVMFIST